MLVSKFLSDNPLMSYEKAEWHSRLCFNFHSVMISTDKCYNKIRKLGI